MKIKNLIEESIKEVSQKMNVLLIGELSKEKIALIDEYSSINQKLINIKTIINRIRNIYRKESTTKDEILLSLGIAFMAGLEKGQNEKEH